MNNYSVPFYSNGNEFYQPVLYQFLREDYEGSIFTGHGNVLFNNYDLIKYPFNLIYEYR